MTPIGSTMLTARGASKPADSNPIQKRSGLLTLAIADTGYTPDDLSPCITSR